MKRYIELVYDNSSSMTGIIHAKQKWQIVLELFEKDILPHIGNNSDKVVLRQLGHGCSKGSSSAETLVNDREKMLKRLYEVTYENSTPLNYSIYDAIEACKKEVADKHLVFILTDGDDTCGVPLNQLIDQETIAKNTTHFQYLLVQFAVDNEKSSRNLFATASFLNCRSITLSASDTIPQMRTKLKETLITSGFAKKNKLEYCFTSKSGPMITWKEAKADGITYHKASILHTKSELKWEPQKDVDIHPLDYAELKFLNSLYFENGLTEDTIKTMLKQLKKPYYYDFNCIYWDFSTSEWRYHQKQNTVDFVDNPEAADADKRMKEPLFSRDIEKLVKDINDEYFVDNELYEVVMRNTISPSFVLRPYLVKMMPNDTITLKKGNIVQFKS